MPIVTNFDLATPLYGLPLQRWRVSHMLHRAEAAAATGCAGKCHI